jgi:hypothetical protein
MEFVKTLSAAKPTLTQTMKNVKHQFLLIAIQLQITLLVKKNQLNVVRFPKQIAGI